ncbi:hypothetical protein FJQ54_08330 [Sandaracinobacter neustonicus]|uniref:DUF3739 domain-containing protein n=1 Tax=Sandaracinobacter neustonicus TaxID=1715348 RepID=A0A501XLP6_9SPHN|nr:hypothetical protein FJQ54_08330 [Sandaracinobacter neustonicus]
MVVVRQYRRRAWAQILAQRAAGGVPGRRLGQTRVQLSGLPNGAGIATLDQVDGRQGGDVDLYAFNGIVDAGDAGIGMQTRLESDRNRQSAE